MLVPLRKHHRSRTCKTEGIFLTFPPPSFLNKIQMYKVTVHLQWDIPFFFTYTKETKKTEEKTALTVQLPALRFCKAPAAASRVLKFWLSVRMERYNRTTSGWYNNSKPAGGARGEEKQRSQCLNTHIPLFSNVREQPSESCYNTERRTCAMSRTFYPQLWEIVETATHAEKCSPGLQVSLLVLRLTILSRICAML